MSSGLVSLYCVGTGLCMNTASGVSQSHLVDIVTERFMKSVTQAWGQRLVLQCAAGVYLCIQFSQLLATSLCLLA